ncbi:MAG TPA: UdgX family uracil-DNA binding protein [Acetobacteraceae bacterium]|nr:UdgX family uracil-DNA binding protein [Acetobacteraceae bacterium]
MDIIGVTLREGADLTGFRAAVRRLVARRVPPELVAWTSTATGDLFGASFNEDAPPIGLPRAVAALIDLVICHRDPERYALLYALVWRVLHGEPHLLENPGDRLVHRLDALRREVRRDLHKMHAFLRFREVTDPDGGERYVAWFEPEHFILQAAAPFFVERFASLAWSILTPQGALHWDRQKLTMGPPAKRGEAPEGDALEAAWRCYYESVFNPARLNQAAMRAEMPRKYWRNLPEAAAIRDLVHGASARVQDMLQREAAVPDKRDPEKAVAAMARQKPQSLEALNRLITAAEPLSPGAARAVLGEGPVGAAIALVGEQPGDQEEREGRPFVGPAGQVLNQALAHAGLDRHQIYVTNAVKHFKFEQRGKRRIHQKPDAGEIRRYRWWLLEELDFVRPRLVVALGATAAQALAGKPISVTRARGETWFGDRHGFVTVHPSYLLRIQDAAAKAQAMREFLADMDRIKALAAA